MCVWHIPCGGVSVFSWMGLGCLADLGLRLGLNLMAEWDQQAQAHSHSLHAAPKLHTSESQTLRDSLQLEVTLRKRMSVLHLDSPICYLAHSRPGAGTQQSNTSPCLSVSVSTRPRSGSSAPPTHGPAIGWLLRNETGTVVLGFLPISLLTKQLL